MKVSDLLRHIIFTERKRIKQPELAKRLGVHASTLSAWKNGMMRPSAENEAKIRQVCAEIHPGCERCAPDISRVV